MSDRSRASVFTVERNCTIDGVTYAKGDTVDVQVAAGWKRLSALMSSGYVTPSPDLYTTSDSGVVRRRPQPRHFDASERRAIVSSVVKKAAAPAKKRAARLTDASKTQSDDAE